MNMILLHLNILKHNFRYTNREELLDLELKGMTGSLSVTLQPVCGTLCRTHSDSARPTTSSGP